eukprot:1600307-Alexandrium_andersonii.AAC.1
MVHLPLGWRLDGDTPLPDLLLKLGCDVVENPLAVTADVADVALQQQALLDHDVDFVICELP